MISYTEYQKLRDAFMLYFIFSLALISFQLDLLNKQTSLSTDLSIQNSNLIVGLGDVDEATLGAVQAIVKVLKDK